MFATQNIFAPHLQVEEGWVQCDRCECWVHQICGLFNKGRNDQDRGYLCPQCLLYGAWWPLPSSLGGAGAAAAAWGLRKSVESS